MSLWIWWLYECVCAGKETCRKQTLWSSVKCQTQQAEGGWWFTERRSCRLLALCGLCWDLIHVTERNRGYFNQQATFEKVPDCWWLIQNILLLHVCWVGNDSHVNRSNNPRQLYINKGPVCYQWFNLQPVHESYPIWDVNTQCLGALSLEKPLWGTKRLWFGIKTKRT